MMKYVIFDIKYSSPVLFQFEFKSFVLLTLAFMVSTVISTLSHEYGHILAAKYLGYHASLHYASMNVDERQMFRRLDSLNRGRILAKTQGIAFEQKAEYSRVVAKVLNDDFYITLGGPPQTIITGFFGLALLLFKQS